MSPEEAAAMQGAAGVPGGFGPGAQLPPGINPAMLGRLGRGQRGMPMQPPPGMGMGLQRERG